MVPVENKAMPFVSQPYHKNNSSSSSSSSPSSSQGLTLQRQLTSHCPEKHVTDSNYIDDLGVLDDSENGLQQSGKILKHSRKVDFQINVKKAKVTSIGKNTSQQPFPEHVNLKGKIRKSLNQVTSFVYLGSSYVMDQLTLN